MTQTFLTQKKFVEALKAENELIEINEKISTELEITEITDRISKQKGGGKALLFNNTGTSFPVLINSLGSEKRICMALGVKNLDDIGFEIQNLFKKITSPKKNLLEKLSILPQLKQISDWIPRTISGKGKCQEIIIKDVDLNILPALKCWPFDGGKFITLPLVHTKNPETQIRNTGMYRLQILSKNTTGMHWHKHKTGAAHYEIYKKNKKIMPVAVALGGDPVYTYVATAPLPENVDEYMFAGFLRKKKVELVRCITQDIHVPADADIILEGYVDPSEELIWEGPFGDHTGFYSLADWYPQFHVTCITHKKNAIYPTTIVGIPPQEDAYIAKATERIFLPLIQLSMLPELNDMNIPIEGVAHNLTICNINKSYSGQALKVMNSLWGAGQMMFNKIMVITDQNIDIHNTPNLIKTIIQQLNPLTDIYFSNGPLDVLDHSSAAFAFGSKLGVDATMKYPEEISQKITNQICPEIDGMEFLTNFSEIKEVNTKLLAQKISMLIISIDKNKPHMVNKITKRIHDNEKYNHVKIVVIIDYPFDIEDYPYIFWLVANNIEPRRDCNVMYSQTGVAQLFVDGTRKRTDFDDFPRNWPNPVIMSNNVIKKIDSIWSQLPLGELIPSPSEKFMKIFIGNDAIADRKMN